jgi:hypothetical protein
MWFVPLACQEPFPTDRHDLEGFRIAALEVAATPDGGAVAPPRGDRGGRAPLVDANGHAVVGVRRR